MAAVDDDLLLELRDARARTLSLLEDLDDEQWFGAELEIVNPPIWELGHVAWFQEHWCLRHLHRLTPIFSGADALYDSAAIPHDVRWRLDFPGRAGTLAYAEGVLERVAKTYAESPGDSYFHELALFHEDMHGEAFVYTRQTLGYPPPPCSPTHVPGGGAGAGDAELAGGKFLMGARPGEGFVFDNEQWAHEVELAPFRMARAPVTQAEFRDFVEDRGYERSELWSAKGWSWRDEFDARHPVHWRRERDGSWSRRRYDRWVPLEDHLPVHVVNAHEAEAWCRWAKRRLPSEAEWELAAGPARFPWGDSPPTAARAQLDLASDEPCEVGAHPLGDTREGLRQMIGNVWEW